ncbi:MAG: hypothetical protein KF893_06275 [Caldilineaceae bacterium]|nr:hypothetical protein [Caldilineaceae bacterium]
MAGASPAAQTPVTDRREAKKVAHGGGVSRRPDAGHGPAGSNCLAAGP